MNFEEKKTDFLSSLKREFSHGLSGEDYEHYLREHRLSCLLEGLTDCDKKKAWVSWQGKKTFLKQLDDWAKEISTPIVLLKGASLQERLYQGEAIRPMSDIDLLLVDEGLELKERLRSQGFNEVFEETWLANRHKQVFVKDQLPENWVVELHYKLSYLHSSFQHWPMQKHTEYSHLYVLKPEVELAFLTYHYAHQHTFLSLLWLFDIFLLAGLMNEKQILESFRWAKFLGAHKSHTICLGLLYELTDDDKLSRFRTQSTVPLSALWNLSNRRLRYFWVKHLLKGGVFSALRYDIHWVWSYKWKLLAKSRAKISSRLGIF